jgi:hypothetical protein
MAMGLRKAVSRTLINMAAKVAQTGGNGKSGSSYSNNKAPDSMNVGSYANSPKSEKSMKNQGMTTGGPFSPGRPLNQFFPQGQPPRQWDFQTGYNIAERPRAVQSKMSFETMRNIIDNYDVAQLCIERREDEIRGMEWSIVPDSTVKPEEDLSTQIRKVTDFFEHPDGQTPFDAWQNAWLDDMLRFDAPAIYVRRTRGGELAGLEVVDGTTIAPLLDFWGHIPDPPAPAYSQFIQGIPDVLLTRDELIYNPFRSSAHSPYGTPPVEWLILTINTDIRWQWYFLQYFTEGSVPDMFMEAPQDSSSPEQIKKFQDLWDRTMSGDQSIKHKITWVPAGSKPIPAKDTKFDSAFPEFLLRKTCAAYKVTPEEIGFTTNSNRSTGQSQENIMYRASLEPLTKYMAGIYTRMIHKYFGLPLRFKFDLGEKEDRLMEAQAHQIYVNIGAESADEIRENILGKKPDPKVPVGRYIMTGAGPLPVDQLGKMLPSVWAPNPEAGQPAMAMMRPANNYSNSKAQKPEGQPEEDDDSKVNKSVGGIPSEEDIIAELHRWKLNSKKRVKKGKSPRQFASEILTDEIHDQVWNRLQGSKTSEEVDRAFSGPFFW